MSVFEPNFHYGLPLPSPVRTRIMKHNITHKFCPYRTTSARCDASTDRNIRISNSFNNKTFQELETLSQNNKITYMNALGFFVQRKHNNDHVYLNKHMKHY